MATNETVVTGPGGPLTLATLLTGIGTPLVMLLLLAMIVLPLPPFALDLLFTFNIALAIIVLLAAVYASRPLEFAVFPTVLLIATLLRLALNVASTRVVLLEGHAGTGPRVTSYRPSANSSSAAATPWAWCCSPFW